MKLLLELLGIGKIPPTMLRKDNIKEPKTDISI